MVGILLVAFAVTTRAVVWIEIEEIAIKSKNIAGHHPCGGVN